MSYFGLTTAQVNAGEGHDVTGVGIQGEPRHSSLSINCTRFPNGTIIGADGFVYQYPYRANDTALSGSSMYHTQAENGNGTDWRSLIGNSHCTLWNHTGTDTFKDLSPYTIEQKVFIGLFLCIIIFLSISGNVLVCIAVLTDRYLKKANNLFYVSLAIADLFVALLVMTPAVANDILGYWIFDIKFCFVWISFDIMCSTSSILNLCAISLDRYIHIKNPYWYEQFMTTRRVLIAIATVWVTSTLISFLPINLGWHTPVGKNFTTDILPMKESKPICLLDLNPIFAVVSSVISFYIPCFVMLIIYFRLFTFARKTAAEIRRTQTFDRFTSSNSGTNNNGKKSKARSSKLSDHKAAVTLGIIMGVFLLCWVPFFIMNIISAFCPECIPAILFSTLTWIGYLNSCLNPIIYSIFNSEFRRAFKKILCSNRCCTKNSKLSRIFKIRKKGKSSSIELNNHVPTPRVPRKSTKTNGSSNGIAHFSITSDDSTEPLKNGDTSDKVTSL